MKLTTKGRYASRAMVDMAMHVAEAPMALRDVAERQQVSVHYLQQIFARLKAAGLVRGMRGARGGFTLARPPAEIKLSEVIQAVEGPIAPVPCVDDPAACQRAGVCAVRDVWAEMGAAMIQVLESKSLQDLVERQQKKEQPQELM